MASPSVLTGIGDDAAVLAAAVGEGDLVWTIDAQVDGTHFRIDLASWEDVGWRSFMAAASDLAAMGATPVAALSALVLAPSFSDDDLDALARGQAAAAQAVGAPVAGGNLARGTETSITTTLLGRATRPITRAGARPGDAVWVAGALGEAGAGFDALSNGVQDASIAFCIEAWLRPRALVAEGLSMRGLASAAIDVSDGLARDATHLAEASGVRLVLDEALLLASARVSLEHVLHGGEDYALLAASAAPLPGFRKIGMVEPWTEGEPRLVLASKAGRRALEPRGFDHFA